MYRFHVSSCLLTAQCAALLVIISMASAARAQTPASTPATAAKPPSTAKKPKKPFVFSMPNMIYKEDLPNNFPIPPYTSNVIKKQFVSSIKGAAEQGAAENITTRDDAPTVYNWYKDFFKRGGWAYQSPKPEDSSKFTKSGPLYLINAQKDKQQVTVFCKTHVKDHATQVSVSLTRLKK